MKIYFVRHGESEANILRQFSARSARHGLTDRGRGQVGALAEKLAGEKCIAIYTSPLLRAVQSAEILSHKLGIPYEVTPALREYDAGICEGRSDDYCWQQDGFLLGEWYDNNWDVRLEGGESFNDIRARFLPFMKLVRELYRGKSGAVVLVGHGGTYKCMLPLILTNVSFFFALEHNIDTAEYVLAETDGDELVCLGWNR
ncbi:MAG: histidine phosphatase family protein [Chloroflexi bacterium]|nr:histidine phosphatase family protein [Chloroflexota bacterium]